jgi:hypothetical protein
MPISICKQIEFNKGENMRRLLIKILGGYTQKEINTAEKDALLVGIRTVEMIGYQPEKIRGCVDHLCSLYYGTDDLTIDMKNDRVNRIVSSLKKRMENYE